ncbi:MAG: hypothetical protein ACR5K7_05890 [Symbiopectobacterium sp.]
MSVVSPVHGIPLLALSWGFLVVILIGGLAFIYHVVAILVDAWMLHRLLNGWQLIGTLIVLAAVAGINVWWLFRQKTAAALIFLLINAL